MVLKLRVAPVVRTLGLDNAETLSAVPNTINVTCCQVGDLRDARLCLRPCAVEDGLICVIAYSFNNWAIAVVRAYKCIRQ